MGTFNAEPSKDFFIDMLTRDIPLEWAILDLIDNSIDGARSEIAKKKKDLKSAKAYNGFKIELSLSATEFSIRDNCGGFSKKAAQDYAFKFGRPKDHTNFPKGSVGRFGVGMKRGIFKIGNYFMVETKHGNDHFIVEEDITTWNNPKSKWEFEYTDIKQGAKYKKHKPELKENGTVVIVQDLKPAVAQDFTSSHFLKRLIEEIQRILSYSLERGLEIIVNKVSLQAKPIELLVANDLKPYYLEETIGKVNVRIYAGIGRPDPNDAGWYIFCNDRLMVEKDRTNLTGWEGSEKFFGDTGVQKFHNKVAMFRGIVFFTADDSSLLPMTTTKTGIDINSALYKTVRSKMINAMKIVLACINKLDNDEQRQEIVRKSKMADIVQYDHRNLKSEFIFPSLKKAKEVDNNVRITYKANREEVEAVKKSLKVNSNEGVGIGTFTYYIKMQELDI